MGRRNKMGGKGAKAQRRKTLGSRKASKVARGRKPSIADATEKIARLTHERDEALEQQTATAEVLRIIASSPGDLDAALEAILENATRICEAKFGVLHRCQDGAFEARAMVGVPPALAHELRRRALFVSPKGAPLDRLLRTKKTIHTVDATKEKVQPPSVMLGGARSHIAVPMIKAGEVVGALTIYRTEVRPFTDSQLTLVLNFAAQAVIAIENTRLLTELRQRTDDLTESLEQQTATSDVLSVISRSKFDLQPVLQSVVDTAVRLCRADQAVISRLDGNAYRFAAGYSLDPEYLEIEKTTLILPGPGTVVGRAAMTRTVAQIDDAMVDPQYEMKEAASIAQIHSMIGVPLMREGEPIGVIALARCRVEPFTEREIELVTTFADQAVIAIENVRLFEDVQKRTAELSESLEQQTATSEVLKVISSSPGELKPVFQAMLENAVRICEAKFGTMFLREEDAFRTVALHNAPHAYAELRRRNPLIHPHPASALRRLVATRQMVHITDILVDQGYLAGAPSSVAIFETAGARTLL
ncbi:MAG: GAF domain-containing protein, partial [Pseudolabrys sp.]